MQLKNYNTYFFFLILLGITVAAFFIFQPFLIAILLAAVFAIIFQRPYKFFLKITGGHEKISALFTALMGILLFSGVFLSVVGLAANEATALYQKISSNGALDQRYIDTFLHNVRRNQFLNAIGVQNLLSQENVNKSLTQLAQGSLLLLQKTYQGVAHFLFLALVMFFTLYSFLIGGKELLKRIMFLSPLKDAHEKILVEKFISISSATVKGTLVVGIVQGSLGGITFALAGIPSPIVWGVVMMFLSLIPMVGSSLIWFPAGIIMLLLGNIWQGVFILAVGLGIISVIDNILRPELVGKDIQMHPLIVFFATLGGISLFGFLGFILGPVIIALFLALWEIYAVEFKTQLRRYNK